MKGSVSFHCVSIKGHKEMFLFGEIFHSVSLVMARLNNNK